MPLKISGFLPKMATAQRCLRSVVLPFEPSAPPGLNGSFTTAAFRCQLKPLGLSVLKMDADGRLGGQGGGGAEASVTLEPSTRGRSHLGRPSGRALPGARGTASSGRWRISSAAMPTSTTPTEPLGAADTAYGSPGCLR